MKKMASMLFEIVIIGMVYTAFYGMVWNFLKSISGF